MSTPYDAEWLEYDDDHGADASRRERVRALLREAVKLDGNDEFPHALTDAIEAFLKDPLASNRQDPPPQVPGLRQGQDHDEDEDPNEGIPYPIGPLNPAQEQALIHYSERERGVSADSARGSAGAAATPETNA